MIFSKHICIMLTMTLSDIYTLSSFKQKEQNNVVSALTLFTFFHSFNRVTQNEIVVLLRLYPLLQI